MAETLISYEPATGETLWTGEAGDPAAEVTRALRAAPHWALTSFQEREAILRRFADLVREEKDGFADLIARETGKPLWEAATEVNAVANKVAISIDAYHDRTPNRETPTAGGTVSVRHKPHGLLAVLGPYNFPAHLPNGHIVPALLAGNAIVFKPSEKTPATGEYLVRLFHKAGVPADLLRIVQGGPETGKALAGAEGIDGLLFTGSALAGMALSRQFAESPGKILALELGGNNPIVAWDDIDIDAAAATIVQSAFLSAGQRCTAARRLIVRDGAHRELLDAVHSLTDRIIVDHPHAEPQPFMGPVIDTGAADQLQRAYEELAARGAKVLKPLERPDAELPFLTPAIVDVTEVADRPDAELFGPVLQTVRVSDFEAAIAEANNTAYGLAASLLGGSRDQFATFWSRARAGVVNWNKPTNGAPSTAPFGGIGISGNHRPSAYYAADYCAYPVTSVEAETMSGSIATGLRAAEDPNMIED
jgi:succinylglutamic semialdehyde dehydrogenase